MNQSCGGHPQAPQLSWTDDLATGIEDIDRQHQRIIDFIGRFEEMPAYQTKAALLEVRSYLVFHFRFEEDLLEEAGYKFARAHKKVHELMIRRLTTLQRKLRAGEDINTELGDLLRNWVYGHIQHDDAAYLPTVQDYLKITGKTNPSGHWWRKLIHMFWWP